MSEIFHNPAVKESPRQDPAPVISGQRDTSILEWLQAQGRLMERDDKDVVTSTLDEDPEYSEALLDNDDIYHDDVDDDNDDDFDIV
jgi:hypothetical protein